MDLIVEKKEERYIVLSNVTGSVLGNFDTKKEAQLYSAQVPESTRVRVLELNRFKREG